MRFVFALLPLSLAVVGTAQAQVIQGTNGPDVLVGTDGHDWVENGAAPGGYRSDGAKDDIDVSGDPGSADDVYMGPEDTLKCDDDDFIRICNKNGAFLWTGSGKEYKAIRAAVDWIRGLIESLLELMPHLTFEEAMNAVLDELGIDEESAYYEVAVAMLLADANADGDGGDE